MPYRKNRKLKYNNQKLKIARNKAWMGTKCEQFAALIFTNLDFLPQRGEEILSDLDFDKLWWNNLLLTHCLSSLVTEHL